MKQLRGLVLLAVFCLTLTLLPVQVSAKSHTYKHNKSKGIACQSAIRQQVNVINDNYISVYLSANGDYISDVKTSSSNLFAKKVSSTVCKNGTYLLCNELDKKYRSKHLISCYARKKGNYTVTVTVSDKNHNPKGTVKIKVYARTFAPGPFKYLSYGGTKYNVSSEPTINTAKASGKLKYKNNAGYKIKGLYVATAFNAKGKPVFKKVTNGKRISLATSTNYSTTGQHITSDTQEKEYGVTYDYLHPVTLVKVKYYDKLLKITTEEIFHLFYVQ